MKLHWKPCCTLFIGIQLFYVCRWVTAVVAINREILCFKFCWNIIYESILQRALHHSKIITENITNFPFLFCLFDFRLVKCILLIRYAHRHNFKTILNWVFAKCSLHCSTCRIFLNLMFFFSLFSQWYSNLFHHLT